MTRRKRQLPLLFPPAWGGKRKGSGPKRKRAIKGVSHRRRPILPTRLPVHVTLRVRAHVYNLRSRRCFQPIQDAFLCAHDRFGFRLTHFSVQGNHIHLIGEAEHWRALARGIQGLTIRIAKGLNRVMQRRGRVFADRYHAHVLRTPTEVRHALQYVLNNHAKHSAQYGEPVQAGYCDPYSSAVFHSVDPPILSEPRTWLLSQRGWR